ncbi:hypothetical protein I302_103458 [Kwoniella bestiolae CBS 10118]|uniref:Uncharacterized protein n=1 Tax=Kwoniella bestiolae CBS 10118 TaxID=1296100 RepID=A0A1B9G8G2_9TREE|nr:hypothetical protein I302_02158 [Kwoniella bestiolae CBS 10118]OCF27317.1 hypothetical protein I302_02158 [Kwoniella bestiolae CBS 10118]
MTHHSRSSSSSTKRHQNSPINHIICILLTLTSTLFLFLVILYNVPFSPNDTGKLGDRLWLVRLIDQSREYGFGVWGWCSWSDSGSASTAFQGAGGSDGVCTRKSFWKVPDSAERGDGVLGLDLPSEISESLSISTFFLTFVLVISTLFLIDLLLTLHFHSPTQPPANHKIYWFPPKKMEYRTWLAYCLRNFWLRVILMIFITAWGLPVLIIAGIGVGKMERDQRVEVKMGSGWTMALVAITNLILVQITIPLGGLWNDSKRSGKKH